MQSWAEAAFGKIARKYPYAVKAAARGGGIPYQGKDGAWVPAPYEGNAWWTNGFWPALMWQLYHATGDPAYQAEARRVQALLAEELMRFEGLHHDVGFQYLLSFGAEYALTKSLGARRTVLHAASLLAGRFNPNGFIRAWNGEGREGWAIIDCLMNLSLLYWASRETGDPRYALIAKAHTDTSIRYFLREDGSSNHIIVFDANTGAMLDAPGGQGYGPGSSWSRGQAWALYGITLGYLNTGEKRYLKAARRTAKYFLANIREDGLTDCDFRQPRGEERLDNIAGACAACGLLELAQAVDATEGEAYRAAALKMLMAIDALTSDWAEDRCGILQKCTASYHDDGAGRHINIVYGDYFFVEAVCKLRGTDIMPWKAIPGRANA